MLLNHTIKTYKKMKKHVVVKSLFVALVGLLPVVSIAQNDSAKHKWTLGMEVNTSLSTTSTYNNPDYLYYSDFIQSYTYAGLFPYTPFDDNQVQNTSLSLGIKVSYYVTDNLSLRLRVGIKNHTLLQNTQDSSNSYNHSEDTAKQNAVYIGIGCQRSINLNKFINMYAGIDFTVTNYGNYIENAGIVNSSGENGYTLHIPGGTTFGLGPVIGFTLKLCKHLGLTAEATDTWMYETLGGIEKQTFSTQFISYNYNYTNTTRGFTNSGIILSVGVLYIH